MNKIAAISDAPIRFRVASGKGAGKVVRDGGNYGAGLIKGFSVITRGEALGHGIWIDKDFLGEVADAGNAFENGIKSRFTHPGMSGDGLSRILGRIMNFKQSGDHVFADLHFVESSHDTPDGDLAKYVMDLADESPDMFGASIVFTPDYGEMDRFSALHEDKDGRFKSPDRNNKNNYPHARLSVLSAADFVDDPAANPDGVFSAMGGNEIPARAGAYLSYALGMTNEIPESFMNGPHPERARQFVAQFLDSHGLEICQKSSIADADPGVWLEEETVIPDNVQNALTHLECETASLRKTVGVIFRQLNKIGGKCK